MLAFSFPPDLEAGTDIFISCSANRGTKPISYTWFKDGRKIVPGSGIEIESNRNALGLSIISATSKHSGNYTCIAENAYGSDSYSANLNIKGARLFIKALLSYLLQSINLPFSRTSLLDIEANECECRDR